MGNPDVMDIYIRLFSQYGESNWWPADTAFEVMVGAILTQQTTWKNVEISINKLKKKGLLGIEHLAKADLQVIEKCLKTSGFFRQKSRRIKNLANHLLNGYSGDLKLFFSRDIIKIRKELLSLEGIGPETADSILLYAGLKPKFVIDAYTFRIFKRLGLDFEEKYKRAQEFFENELPKDVGIFKNYHAYLVELGKNYCRTNPKCIKCPLNDICEFHGNQLN
jgi:endonuclease-3 related protein